MIESKLLRALLSKWTNEWWLKYDIETQSLLLKFPNINCYIVFWNTKLIFSIIYTTLIFRIIFQFGNLLGIIKNHLRHMGTHVLICTQLMMNFEVKKWSRMFWNEPRNGRCCMQHFKNLSKVKKSWRLKVYHVLYL